MTAAWTCGGTGPLTLTRGPLGRDPVLVAWHLRVFETADGRGSCRWSTTTLDDHDTLDAALAHLRDVADDVGPSRVFLHARTGEVRLMAEFNPGTTSA